MSEKNLKKRRLGIGANVLVAVAALASILGVLNTLAFRHPFRWDWTRTRLFTLSDKTTKVLDSLQNPVEIVIFYQPTHALYKRVYDLLKEFDEKGKGKLRLEFIDPDRDVARTRLLAAKLKVDALNTVVVANGEKIKQVGDSDLVEYDFTALQPGVPPKIKNFKGEEAVTNALLSVTQERPAQIYFLTGHGEKDIEAFGNEGIAVVKRLLEKNNMKAEKLLLLGKKEIPKDCDLLVIAGPTKPITAKELELIADFAAKGGGVWVMVDPLTVTELEPLLASWGVEIGNNVVVDPKTGVPFISAANLFISHYSNHPITKNMNSVATLFVMVRSVQPLPADKAPKDWRATPLAFTSEAGWGEVNVMSQTYQFNEKEDVKGPVAIAVAAESQAGAAVKGRVVVIGDSEFCTNTQLQNVGNTDFVDNLLQWLLQREKLVSLAPKISEQIQLHLNSQQMTGLFWISVLGLPFFGLSLGGAVWFRRRK